MVEWAIKWENNNWKGVKNANIIKLAYDELNCLCKLTSKRKNDLGYLRARKLAMTPSV